MTTSLQFPTCTHVFYSRSHAEPANVNEQVSERKYTMPEVAAASKEGRVVEAFGAGTACVVSPINNIEYNGTQYAIPLNPDDANDGAGPVTKRLLTEVCARVVVWCV